MVGIIACSCCAPSCGKSAKPAQPSPPMYLCEISMSSSTDKHTGHPGATHFLSCGIGHQRRRRACCMHCRGRLLTARRQLRLPSTRQFTSAHKATQYLTGRKPCGPLLMPPAARNHVTVTSARLRRFFRAFHLQLDRCC